MQPNFQLSLPSCSIVRLIGDSDWSSPVMWCTTSSRESSSSVQAVKTGATSSAGSVTVSADLSVRERARTSSPRWRRPSIHSSCCSANTAPTSRINAVQPEELA